jgi:hypothetical protein
LALSLVLSAHNTLTARSGLALVLGFVLGLPQAVSAVSPAISAGMTRFLRRGVCVLSIMSLKKILILLF